MGEEKKEVVVYISGTWDLFHYGHLRMLKRAKELGDKLIVGVNTDKYVESFKGKPIMRFEERREIIDGLKCVDRTVPHSGAEETYPLVVYKVNIRVVGNDWGQTDGQKKAKEKMNGIGIKLVVLPRTKGISSSIIKKRIKNEGIL